MKKSVLIISHGSRLPTTKIEVGKLVDRLKDKSHDLIFKYAFLELAEPSIPQGIEACIADGADEVVVILNFLNAGVHVDKDIPQIISDSRIKHPNVDIRISGPIGQHPKIVDLFLDLIQTT